MGTDGKVLLHKIQKINIFLKKKKFYLNLIMIQVEKNIHIITVKRVSPQQLSTCTDKFIVYSMRKVGFLKYMTGFFPTQIILL